MFLVYLKSKIKFVDVLGWLGNIFFILGAYFLSVKKYEYGFICNIIANVPYVIMGFKNKMSSLFILSIVLMVINGYGAYNQ